MGVCVVRPRYDLAWMDNQWDFATSNFQPDDVCDFPLAGHVVPPGHEVVLLTPLLAHDVQGETSLKDFHHPDNAMYVFGSDKTHLFEDEIGDLVDHKVYVPVDDHHEMYSWTAYAVTMWDRRMKLG